MADKKKYGFNGKYCTGCNSVWEMALNTGTVPKEIIHPDFPSYGLKRVVCKYFLPLSYRYYSGVNPL